MRDNYNIILGLLLVTAIAGFFISIGVMIGRRIEQNNQVSFPFSETVGVGLGTGSASTSFLKKEFGDEYETIMAAAHRNACDEVNLLILFAIRKAENGPPGNEFGIMCQSGTGLDTQAGWAAATIMKNRKRWDDTGQLSDFIEFLADKYCPAETDSVGNKNWKNNVMYWTAKFITWELEARLLSNWQ